MSFLSNNAATLENMVFSKDNFLLDYEKVLQESDTFEYKSSPDGIYPGIRTKDLAVDGYGKDIVDSAVKLLFPQAEIAEYHFHYHVNVPYPDAPANTGWIHSDGTQLTGLIYLTPNTIDATAGTTFHNQRTRFLYESEVMRQFFMGECSVSEYLTALEVNNNQYELINDVPFVTNRLVMFDSRTPHAPKDYRLKNGAPRKSILFYVNFS